MGTSASVVVPRQNYKGRGTTHSPWNDLPYSGKIIRKYHVFFFADSREFVVFSILTLILNILELKSSVVDVSLA